MTSVEREIPAPTDKGNGERGMVNPSTALWDDTVAAVVRGFEGAFALTAKDVKERRRGEAREIVTDRRDVTLYEAP